MPGIAAAGRVGGERGRGGQGGGAGKRRAGCAQQRVGAGAVQQRLVAVVLGDGAAAGEGVGVQVFTGDDRGAARGRQAARAWCRVRVAVA